MPLISCLVITGFTLIPRTTSSVLRTRGALCQGKSLHHCLGDLEAPPFCLLSRSSTGNPLDNKAHPMANTSQALDLEGIIHREMHEIAEQIRIMNEINACLVQHLATNNPPPPIAPIPNEADWARHSYRVGDQDSQSRHSTSQRNSAKSHPHQSMSLHSRHGRNFAMSESRSSSRILDTTGEETKRRGRSPCRDDQALKCRDKSTTQKIKDRDARIDAINTGTNGPVTVDTLIK
ncbi:hypothetical protein Acr_17g0007260 [Actinidia rufa]|uniref:Uncharacterized protein n=1 Tax=Actinidia rufa TaxID=165716 RepID=A0A7J0G2Z5_9ERIC|nr:hypothetical protein Acr_17g0007260 [Actinidia rufa]